MRKISWWGWWVWAGGVVNWNFVAQVVLVV